MADELVLRLRGLNCPNCASMIEEKVAELGGVRSSSLNLMNQRLAIELDGDKSSDDVLSEARSIVDTIEPGVKVELYSEAREQAKEQGAGFGRTIARLIVAGVLLVLARVLSLFEGMELGLYFVSFALAGGDVLWGAIMSVLRSDVFNERTLMSVATIGAFSIGDYPEGIAVMLFYQVGELFQDLAVHRSRSSIRELMDIRPDSANLMENGQLRVVTPEEVRVGDHIAVRPGERIPLDGVVVEGSSALDTSALTGESLARDVEVGDEVLSGCIVSSGMLTIEVKKPYGESTAARILELVENAGANKARTEQFITRFTRIYMPIVVGLAAAIALLPPLFVTDVPASEWLYRALVFLVISCPCALVISVPMGFFAGVGSCSRKGILVKGANYLEALAKVTTVVMDKTGTLTSGKFSVKSVHPAGGLGDDQLLRYAGLAEFHSSHPIARSLVRGADIKDAPQVSGFTERAGFGVSANVEGHEVVCANAKLLSELGESADENRYAASTVHVSIDGKYAGCIEVEDAPKPTSAEAVKELKALGVQRIAMLTGDADAAAKSVASQVGIGEVHSSLLPDMKVSKLESMLGGGTLAFVGDGINDAPVLARADVGIAMGALGSDAAIEAADVVIMNDDLCSIPLGIAAARRTRRIVGQSIALAISVKVVVLALGALGIATMWAAVFADVGVALLAVLNSMRALK